MTNFWSDFEEITFWWPGRYWFSNERHFRRISKHNKTFDDTLYH